MMHDERYDFVGELDKIQADEDEACDALLAKIDAIRDYHDLDHIDRVILDILEEVIELL